MDIVAVNSAVLPAASGAKRCAYRVREVPGVEPGYEDAAVRDASSTGSAPIYGRVRDSIAVTIRDVYQQRQ